MHLSMVYLSTIGQFSLMIYPSEDTLMKSHP